MNVEVGEGHGGVAFEGIPDLSLILPPFWRAAN
jgi:hypothetical protein